MSGAIPSVNASNPHVAAGTQVVLKTDVLGTNDLPVHPRGAVGIVARTPAGNENLYLVRFPDGFESSFTYEQFEILRHFKDRLGDGADVEEFCLDQCVIYRCVVGSRAYGLEGDNSDTDRRGIYLAPLDMQLSLFGAPEQFEDNTEQTCYWELQKFVVMALKANPNILECLYSPQVEKITAVGEQLLLLRESFLSQMIFQTFNGYALSQFKKLEQDRRNQGVVRWKHAMHLLRLLLTGAAALRLRRVPVRVEAHREQLLAVKSGEMPWAEIDAWRQSLHRDFESALRETSLPERPDYDAANRFLIGARHNSSKAQPPFTR